VARVNDKLLFSKSNSTVYQALLGILNVVAKGVKSYTKVLDIHGKLEEGREWEVFRHPPKRFKGKKGVGGYLCMNGSERKHMNKHYGTSYLYVMVGWDEHGKEQWVGAHRLLCWAMHGNPKSYREEKESGEVVEGIEEVSHFDPIMEEPCKPSCLNPFHLSWKSKPKNVRHGSHRHAIRRHMRHVKFWKFHEQMVVRNAHAMALKAQARALAGGSRRRRRA
jgi:hypothetical protein